MDEPVQQHSIEYAMITREQFNLWYNSYQILELIKQSGTCDEAINIATANLTADNCENNMESE